MERLKCLGNGISVFLLQYQNNVPCLDQFRVPFTALLPTGRYTGTQLHCILPCLPFPILISHVLSDVLFNANDFAQSLNFLDLPGKGVGGGEKQKTRNLSEPNVKI